MAIKCSLCGDDTDTGQRHCGEPACPWPEMERVTPSVFHMQTHRTMLTDRNEWLKERDHSMPFIRDRDKPKALRWRPIQTAFLDVTTGKVVHEIVPPSTSSGRFHFWKANGRWFLETPHGVIAGQEVQHLIDWIDKVKSIFEVRL